MSRIKGKPDSKRLQAYKKKYGIQTPEDVQELNLNKARELFNALEDKIDQVQFQLSTKPELFDRTFDSQSAKSLLAKFGIKI